MREDTKNNFLVISYYSIETPQVDKSHLKVTTSAPSSYLSTSLCVQVYSAAIRISLTGTHTCYLFI